jgi:NADPH:quinone reductase-like Zn-dependent oxidoreductase
VKAWRFTESFGLENLQFVDVPYPVPGPGEAIVHVHACSLNYRDLVVSKGGYGRAVKPPLVPLSDAAGEVLAVGEGVTRVKPGDRVAGAFMQRWIEGEPDEEKGNSALGGAIQGVLAEQICLKAEGLVHLPPHLSYEEGATLPCAGVTAWNALFEQGGLKAGQSVLVQGSGGVSVIALQLAKMAGARVIATSSSDAKLERLKALGADGLINYKTTPDWDKAAKALVGSGGVDHIVEVGGTGTLPLSIKTVRRGGHIALIGVLSGGAETDVRPIFMKSVRVTGIYVGSRVMFEALNRAVSLSGLKPIVDRVFPFSEAPEAMRHMESGAHFGKICIAGLQG